MSLTLFKYLLFLWKTVMLPRLKETDTKAQHVQSSRQRERAGRTHSWTDHSFDSFPLHLLAKRPEDTASDRPTHRACAFCGHPLFTLILKSHRQKHIGSGNDTSTKRQRPNLMQTGAHTLHIHTRQQYNCFIHIFLGKNWRKCVGEKKKSCQRKSFASFN